MDRMRLLPTLMALAALASAPLPPPADAAEGLPDADVREIRSYILTEEVLARYVEATRKLSAIRLECNADDAGVEDLSDAAAKIDAIPGARTALRSAGLTSREYVLFAFALIENAFAAHALDQPGGRLPPGISIANVEFFKKHAAEIAKLGQETEAPGCEGGGEA